MYKNMLLVCGRPVHTTLNILCINIINYAQYPHFNFFKSLDSNLYSFYKLFKHQLMHIKNMQFITVNLTLYSQSTGPTITTTYNK